jgi:hypothetical protein
LTVSRRSICSHNPTTSTISVLPKLLFEFIATKALWRRLKKRILACVF